MPLDFTIDSVDSLDESIRQFYVERDGQFVLDVVGVKPEDEFSKVHGLLQQERNTRKQLESKIKQFGDITPDKFYSLQDKLEELQSFTSEGQLDTSKLDSLVEKRLKPYDRKIDKISSERDQAMQELSNLKQHMLSATRDNKITELAANRIKPEFIKDLHLRAKYELEYSEDMDTFIDPNGLSMDEWVAKQLKDTPSWGLDTKGTGMKNPANAPTVVVNNPFAKETFSLTEQARLYRDDPELYEKLKKQAGVQ